MTPNLEAGSSEDNTSHSGKSAEVAAAIIIQRLWRSRNNNAKQELLNTASRWNDVVVRAEFEAKRDDAQQGRNSPQARWRRVVFFVRRLVDQNALVAGEDFYLDSDKVESKELETQHWLELVDRKHRYGSNLKWYHHKWLEDETRDNFFHWLDHGGGRQLDLTECPREELEKERVIYLSAEQRLNYLVNVGKDGKLYWAKNDLPVDTAPGRWKDAGDGAGVVPVNLPESVERLNAPERMARTRARDHESETSKSAATHYVDDIGGKHSWSRYFKNHFTLRALVNKVLRKTVQRNTWMYISDRNFNIFVGIKETGSFQHSSFIAGGLVTSAGLIKAKDGRIYTLSPLSGHYRTSVDHFRQFIDVLRERGVDMSRLHIAKEEAILRGVEQFGKAKKQALVVKAVEKKVKEAAITGVHPSSHWKGDGAEDESEPERRQG